MNNVVGKKNGNNQVTENSTHQLSKKKWDKWINSFSSPTSQREWYKILFVDQKKLNTNIIYEELDEKYNLFDFLIDQIEKYAEHGENYNDIILNLYVNRDKYVQKGSKKTYGYYVKNNTDISVKSGVFFNFLLPSDSNLIEKLNDKNKLAYVGQITLGQLKNENLISKITHDDIRDNDDRQNPSVCNNIYSARKKPLSKKKLFTPRYKSSKGDLYGPDAECKQIYGIGEESSVCINDKETENEAIDRISKYYCDEETAKVGIEACENKKENTICDTVKLPDLQDLNDTQKKEEYRNIKKKCNSLRWSDDGDAVDKSNAETWNNLKVCNWNGINNKCEREPRKFERNSGVKQLCNYKEKPGRIYGINKVCEPNLENIKKSIHNCNVKRQNCEKTMACLTDVGLPDGLPKFLRPLDVKFFKKETAPVPICCARSFRAVARNVMNIQDFVRVFNYQTSAELKEHLSKTKTSADFQKYLMTIHDEQEAKMKEQLKNMPKLSKEDEVFFTHISADIQVVLGKKINEMIDNLKLQGNVKDMPKIEDEQQSWWSSIASGVGKAALLPFKGIAWIIKTVTYLIYKGFDLISWILRNQAMTMLLLAVIKQFKDGACRWVSNKWYGENIVEVGLVGKSAAVAANQLNNLSYFKGFLINNMWEWVSTKEGFSQVWDASGKLLAAGATFAFGTVTGGAGFLASGAIGAALTTGFGMAKGAIADSVTMYAEMKIVTNVGKDAMDILLNWQMCLYQRVQQKLTLRGVKGELNNGFEAIKGWGSSMGNMISNSFSVTKGGNRNNILNFNYYKNILKQEKDINMQNDLKFNEFNKLRIVKMPKRLKKSKNEVDEIIKNIVQTHNKGKIKNKSDLFKIMAIVLSNKPKSEFTINDLQLLMLGSSYIPEFKFIKKKKKKKSPKRKKSSKKQIGNGKCSYKELETLTQKMHKKNDSLIKEIYKKNGNKYIKYDSYLCGEGSFKKVWAGFDTKNKSLIAWNEVDTNNLLDEKRLENEILLLSNLDHPSILKLKDYWINSSKYTLITEIFNNNTLDNYFKNNNKKDTLKKLTIQILNGIEYIHNNNIIHRDIKPENIGINNNDIKIMDFGLSTKYLTPKKSRTRPTLKRAQTISQNENFSTMGTPMYMAPEIFEEKYNKTVDIYAFGHTLLQIILDTPPYYKDLLNVKTSIYLAVIISQKQKPIYKLYTKKDNLNEILSLEYEKYIIPNNSERDTVDKIQKYLQDNYPKEKEIIDISISNNRLSAEALINIYTDKKKYSDYVPQASTQRDFLKKDEKNNPQNTTEEKFEYKAADDDLFAPPVQEEK
jgi:serine/threonine protein kinase